MQLIRAVTEPEPEQSQGAHIQYSPPESPRYLTALWKIYVNIPAGHKAQIRLSPDH